MRSRGIAVRLVLIGAISLALIGPMSSFAGAYIICQGSCGGGPPSTTTSCFSTSGVPSSWWSSLEGSYQTYLAYPTPNYIQEYSTQCSGSQNTFGVDQQTFWAVADPSGTEGAGQIAGGWSVTGTATFSPTGASGTGYGSVSIYAAPPSEGVSQWVSGSYGTCSYSNSAGGGAWTNVTITLKDTTTGTTVSNSVSVLYSGSGTCQDPVTEEFNVGCGLGGLSACSGVSETLLTSNVQITTGHSYALTVELSCELTAKASGGGTLSNPTGTTSGCGPNSSEILDYYSATDASLTWY